MYPRPILTGGGAAGVLAATGVNIGIALGASLGLIVAGVFVARRAAFARKSDR
ncbi:hypothetical protein P3T37_006086 [Kitasatospora sp. MAA4]|nr:hypothetical protein [Kitasatospora sp. MAA4]